MSGNVFWSHSPSLRPSDEKRANPDNLPLVLTVSNGVSLYALHIRRSKSTTQGGFLCECRTGVNCCWSDHNYTIKVAYIDMNTSKLMINTRKLRMTVNEWWWKQNGIDHFNCECWLYNLAQVSATLWHVLMHFNALIVFISPNLTQAVWLRNEYLKMYICMQVWFNLFRLLIPDLACIHFCYCWRWIDKA